MKSLHAYILTGSNLGNRAQQLATARQLLNQRLGNLVKMSTIYETAAWGITKQPAFLNQVLVYRTGLDGTQLLRVLLDTEIEMGRTRHMKWAERTIDIDLLLLGSQIISEDNLQVPHPFMHQRKFTLVPLHEVAPEFIHPILGKSISELLQNCSDNLEVKPW